MSSENEQVQVDEGHDAEFLKAFDELAAGKQQPPADEPEGTQEASSEVEAEEPEQPAEQPEAEAPESPPSEAAEGAEEAPVAEQQAPAEDDLWKDHPQLKALYEQAQHKARSDARRVSALSAKLRALEGAVKPPEKGSEAEARTIALEAAISKIEEDYPEVGRVLRKVADQQKEELRPVREAIQTVATSAEEDALAEEMAILDEGHQGWRDLVKTQEFVDWAQSQTPGVKALLGSSLAADVSVGLSLYRAAQDASKTPEAAPQPSKEAAATEARRSQQLEGGKEVRSRPAPAASGPPEDFEAAFEFFAEKKLRALSAPAHAGRR